MANNPIGSGAGKAAGKAVKGLIDKLPRRKEAEAGTLDEGGDPRSAKQMMKPMHEPGVEAHGGVSKTVPDDYPTRGEATQDPNQNTPPGLKTKRRVPVSQEEAAAIQQQRNEGMGQRQAPNPRNRQGVAKGRINTVFYDDDGLAASVAAAAETLSPEEKSITMEDLRLDVLSLGVHRKVVDELLADAKVKTTIGDNKIAQKMYALKILHDHSADKIEDYMMQAQSGLITDKGRMELLEALTQHKMILAQYRKGQTDVARAMNVFKTAHEKGDTNLDVERVLDQFAGTDQLRELADAYLKAKTSKQRNKLIEVGIFRRGWNALVYTAQSTFLTLPDTHIYNFTANAMTLMMDPIDRIPAIAVGAVRQRLGKVLGGIPDPDRYTLEDMRARYGGLYNGFLDGSRMAVQGMSKTSHRDSRHAWDTDLFSDAPVRIFGHQIGRTPDLKGTYWDTFFTTMGATYSTPIRALATVDGFLGGVAQRMQLHEEAYRMGVLAYDDAIVNGMSPEDAYRHAQQKVVQLVTERPESIEASIRSERERVGLLSNWDNDIPTAGFYNATQRIFNYPPFKPLMLFSKSVTNLAIEGAARSPLFLISPRFHKMWQAGGRQRDVAISKVVTGTAMSVIAYDMAMNGRITGGGPGPTRTEEQRNIEGMGVQGFSFVIGADEMDDPKRTIEALKVLFGEHSIGDVPDAEGKYYLSFKRVEPATMPFLLGAAYADAVRYSPYDPDDNWFEELGYPALAAVAEYSTNSPQMQFFAQITEIFGEGHKSLDDRVISMADAYLRQTASVVAAGFPGAGIAMSPVFGKGERLMDPTSSSLTVREDQVDAVEFAQLPVVRSFFEAWNRIRSRIYSEGIPDRLDPRGRPVVPYQLVADDPDAFDYVKGAMSPFKISKGRKYDELDGVLAALNHGIGYPDMNIHGVPLTSEQEHEYLSAQRKGIAFYGTSKGRIPMDKAIMDAVEGLIEHYERNPSDRPAKSVFTDTIDQIVAQYREAIRREMFGSIGQDDPTSPYYLDTPLAKVKHPKTALKMVKNLNKAHLYDIAP